MSDESAAPALPRAWWHHAETLYDQPLTLRYPGLDSAARYRMRVVYGGDRPTEKIRLVTNGADEVHGYVGKRFEPLEFDAVTTARMVWPTSPAASE